MENGDKRKSCLGVYFPGIITLEFSVGKQGQVGFGLPPDSRWILDHCGDPAVGVFMEEDQLTLRPDLVRPEVNVLKPKWWCMSLDILLPA